MRRLLVVLALVAAACGGGTVSPSDSAVDAIDNTASVAEDGPDSTSATEEVTDTTATAEEGTDSTSAADQTDTADAFSRPFAGRPAPDFVLALGEGGEFSPSSEDKPIYMVFWAEW